MKSTTTFYCYLTLLLLPTLYGAPSKTEASPASFNFKCELCLKIAHELDTVSLDSFNGHPCDVSPVLGPMTNSRLRDKRRCKDITLELVLLNLQKSSSQLSGEGKCQFIAACPEYTNSFTETLDKIDSSNGDQVVAEEKLGSAVEPESNYDDLIAGEIMKTFEMDLTLQLKKLNDIEEGGEEGKAEPTINTMTIKIRQHRSSSSVSSIEGSNDPSEGKVDSQVTNPNLRFDLEDSDDDDREETLSPEDSINEDSDFDLYGDGRDYWRDLISHPMVFFGISLYFRLFFALLGVGLILLLWQYVFTEEEDVESDGNGNAAIVITTGNADQTILQRIRSFVQTQNQRLAAVMTRSSIPIYPFIRSQTVQGKTPSYTSRTKSGTEETLTSTSDTTSSNATLNDSTVIDKSANL